MGGARRAAPATRRGRRVIAPAGCLPSRCARLPRSLAPASPAQCRRALQYTYVSAYYLPASREKPLFEHLQEQLERATEHLAELTEQPVHQLQRADIANYTAVTRQFLRNLLQGMADGLMADAA